MSARMRVTATDRALRFVVRGDADRTKIPPNELTRLRSRSVRLVVQRFTQFRC